MRVAARISQQEEGFPAAQAERLRRHIDPILCPIVKPEQRLSRQRFVQLLRRDKKRIASTLRSVLLQDAAQPIVTTQISDERWYDAFLEEAQLWHTGARLVDWSAPRAAHHTLKASKSEMNRALLIAHLRPGETQVMGEARADDVLLLSEALAVMARDEQPASVRAGLGGTTFRFLLVGAALRAASTSVLADAALLARPHAPLLAALRGLGAQITLDERGAHVSPLPVREAYATAVRCDASSQFASALALLAASGRSLTLTLSTRDDGGFDASEVASKGYFEMTLAMLQQAGVACQWQGPKVMLRPTPSLHEPARLLARPDESSAAIWRVASALGAPVTLSHQHASTLQPDGLLPDFIQKMTRAREEVTLNLHGAPDLAPVLTALAVGVQARVIITGAAHLRLKESNRIDDLCEAYRGVGITVKARGDGLEIPAGIQRARAGARWKTFGDHRLVMAGALLTLHAPLWIEERWAVAKSYPGFWSDMLAAGASISST